MATMSDVARAAGVSVMTVSNVLNDRGRVSAETRLRVLEKVREIGYEIDLTARRLRAGRTDTVALIVPRFDHAYFGDLAAAFAEAFALRGRHLVVEQSGASVEGELSALSLARLRMYDGVILSPVGLGAPDLDRIAIPTPIVMLGEQQVPERFDHVTMANAEGARMAVAHLIGSGARRVAIVGGARASRGVTMSSQRTDGWRAAHADAGLAADPELVLEVREPAVDGARDAIARAVRDGLGVDAVFAVTDQIAFGVLAGLADAGVAVPGDVQVIGFDDVGISRHIAGGLSTVDPGSRWIVEQAVETLEARMARADFAPRHLVSPARLVLRATTKAAPSSRR
ncbi:MULTISPECIES: LacI family DNA-binding transcriptional regulator [Microbacterium]|uniref:LacI family DNA-binding transcriptional regulator n=1 Tax=Microbacterium TaxID=33882 RepID=UPI0024AFF217|nr:LacI family DNA-binding transcriptional regulator [Microbacterium barkeri]MDI6944531.1 LacI family DNA-binding transcriptional regulator [Microbacterium barkeri]